MVDKLKVELKQALRSYMDGMLDKICVDFEEHVDLSCSQPSTALEGAEFDRYFDCCRQLVKYIAKTMDTSSDFVEKMDCVILASRNDASKAMLDAVMKQDVWFCRRRDIHFNKQVDVEKSSASTQTLGKRKPLQSKPSTKRYRMDKPPTAKFMDASSSPEEEMLVDSDAELQVIEILESEDEDNDEAEDDIESISMESAVNEEQEEEKDTTGSTEVVKNLCLLKPQYPGQLEAIRAWIHDLNKLLDAKWCIPPMGYFCSRNCARGEAVMNCMWQSIEVHLDERQNERCELKTRVELGQTKHLIEVKQLEICGVRHDLKEKKVNWSMAVHYDDESCWVGDQASHDSEITMLEDMLKRKRHELSIVEYKKNALCARMDTIRLDWRDEDSDNHGGNALHYIRKM
ncbi:hypothetical protein L914_09169 [Phytophthora nicotianae]|uniref:Uncharacterized protein n=2 Tax=Phytophthora nicotianae TaxID=4792 RepID=V9F3J6_PHYNI|nr:hypothetical protein F443_09500 [Phytophthora nicotianae P1569]ETM45890.1 hypothetical protein L914_09169 [Phytophthora nicotianae]